MAFEDLDCHVKGFYTYLYTKDLVKVFGRGNWYDAAYILMLKIKASGSRGRAVLKNKRLEIIEKLFT